MNLSNLLVTCVLLVPTLCSRNIFTGITQQCKTRQELIALKDSDDEAWELAKNTSEFATLLVQPQTKSVGEGAFGHVFLYQYTFSAKGRQGVRNNAVKVITLPEDSRTSGGSHLQNLYMKEMNASIVLDQMDEQNLYFPRYDGCVEVTKDFSDLMEQPSARNKEHITVDKNTATFLYFTQKLDTDLFKFTKKFQNGTGPFLNQMNRVQLAINTMKALLVMNQKYLHCDIKPENIMLKKVSNDRASELFQLGLKPLETSPSDIYQSFVIDFGLVVDKNIRCSGGTPGFLAQEFFTQGSHAQFDAFGVAMMMIDTEFASLGLENLSDVLAVSQTMKYKGISKFTSNDKVELNQTDLMKNIIFRLDKDEFVEDIRKLAIELYPPIVEELKRIDTTHPWGTYKPSVFLFQRPLVFEALVMAAMQGFNYNSPFTQDLADKMVSLKAAILQYKQDIAQQQEVQLNTQKLELAEAFLRTQLATKSFRRSYYDILFKMIQTPSVRLSLSGGLQQIQTLFAQFKKNNKADLKLVDMERTRNTTSNLTAIFDQAYQESRKQSEDQQMLNTRKEALDQHMQSRMHRMASIYQRRRIVL